MNERDPWDEPFPPLGPDDPPPDVSREEAAYLREEAHLVQHHRGKIALIRKNDVVGVFATADEAILEGFRRFGDVRMVLKEIRDPNEPADFVSLVDVNHPSVRRVEATRH